MAQNIRLNKVAGHRTVYDSNKAKLLKTQDICGICGKPIDKNIKYPDPMSATVDHIIPISKGGHPSDINNLQLAHFCCNRQKSNNHVTVKHKDNVVIGNRNLPHTINWSQYKAED